MKKAFTLFELLIVIWIIWLLVGSIWQMFSYKNVNPIKYDTCYVNINWKIDNFLQDAILQKSVYTWSSWNKVSSYDLFFDINNQKINFVYSWAWVVDTINLNWTWEDSKYDCFTNTYNTLLSWENLKISMSPWLQVDNNAWWNAWMIIYTWSSFNNSVLNGWTWWVNLYYCEWSWWNCYERNKIIVDSKVHLFKKYFCKNEKEISCSNWSE